MYAVFYDRAWMLQLTTLLCSCIPALVEGQPGLKWLFYLSPYSLGLVKKIFVRSRRVHKMLIDWLLLLDLAANCWCPGGPVSAGCRPNPREGLPACLHIAKLVLPNTKGSLLWSSYQNINCLKKTLREALASEHLADLMNCYVSLHLLQDTT